MYQSTNLDPDVRQAEIDYRLAVLTRDYRRLRPVRPARWRRGRSRDDRLVG